MTASDQLDRALITLAARGGRPRCSDPGAHAYWMSESQAERAMAVTWCAGCPVLEMCGQAATERGEAFGVWGATDHTKRPRSERAKENPNHEAI